MFIVERRMPNVSTADLATLHEALFLGDRLTFRGEPVRCLSSTFLPNQARLLTLFEADSAEAVRRPNENVQPEREDLARRLIGAYLETGQHARAAALQQGQAAS